MLNNNTFIMSWCFSKFDIILTYRSMGWDVQRYFTASGFPCSTKFRSFDRVPSFLIISSRSLRLLWLKSRDNKLGLYEIKQDIHILIVCTFSEFITCISSIFFTKFTAHQEFKLWKKYSILSKITSVFILSTVYR